MLKPGGKLLIRSPASLENCRREQDFRNVTAFFNNWRYNFVGANLLVNKLRHIGFGSIRYRQLPFWTWGLTWNFVQHVLLWKFRLKMRTMMDMERIIWRTSKAFVFGNAYNTVLAVKEEDRDEIRLGAGLNAPALQCSAPGTVLGSVPTGALSSVQVVSGYQNRSRIHSPQRSRNQIVRSARRVGLPGHLP